MKKLMIALAVAAIAGITQAASCTWGSGALKTAASAEGGWSATGVNAVSALVSMNVYFIDADTYTSLASATQKDLYDSYSTKTADLTGQNKNATGTIIGAITITDSSAPANAQYAVVTATYKDATYGDMYMATTALSTFNSATSKGSATSLFTPVSNWQVAASSPVPEPTSGLLMLLGVAGLALRRRRA